MKLKDQIESLIDLHSVEAVLTATCEACFDKSEHVETNWQDETLAEKWNTIAGRISLAAETAHLMRTPGISQSKP